MEGTPTEEPLAKLSQPPVGLFSILKEDTTGPSFLHSPQPHPVFRENEFVEGKRQEVFPQAGQGCQAGAPAPPPAHLSDHPFLPAPTLSDHLSTLPHA